jgi:hypothetical protein
VSVDINYFITAGRTHAASAVLVIIFRAVFDDFYDTMTSCDLRIKSRQKYNLKVFFIIATMDHPLVMVFIDIPN